MRKPRTWTVVDFREANYILRETVLQDEYEGKKLLRLLRAVAPQEKWRLNANGDIETAD